MGRKYVSVLLAATMTAAMLAGCGSTDGDKSSSSSAGANTSTSTSTSASSDTGAEAEETTYPMDTDVTFTYWGALNGNVSANYTSLADTELGKMWQEQTGVKIEFQHPAAGQEQEQFNLIVADGNYPDLWDYFWGSNYPGGPEKAIEDGVILDLTDLIDKYCPNLKAYLAAHPDVDKSVKTDSGKYYTFPCIREIQEGCTALGPMIRKDLLDKAGVDVPTTVDEWHTALTALKELGVEIPLSWSFGDKGKGMAYAWGTPEGWVKDDGKAVYGPSKEAYKDYLTTMRQWYAEGLLDPDMFAGGDDLTNTMLSSGKIAATFAYAGSGLQACTTSGRQENPDFELVGCPWPSLEKGKVADYAARSNPYFNNGTSIGGTCKDPVTAAKLLDYGYSQEGHLMFNFGKEGESYTMTDEAPKYTELLSEGTGRPVYTDDILNNPDGLPIAQAMGNYLMACYQGPFVQSGEYQMQYYALDEAKNAVSSWADNNATTTNLPSITPSTEESAEFAQITNEMKTYVEEMTAKFILGTEDINAGFDTYLKTLNQMGLERATEIQNEALERYENR